ncbi:MAG: hypothetical protein HQK62_01505 [Desulfamplus sp.]|nr:hypothetical protein [Desulfamplus sp.]
MKKLLSGALLFVLVVVPFPTMAEVRVGISISLPPFIIFHESPKLIVLPETYVYVVPDIDEEIFFYDGWWWRPWEGRWYRSRCYNSGWDNYIDVPSFCGDVPSNWRDDYKERNWRGLQWNHEPISYEDVQQNWSVWEKNSYWEKQTWRVQGLESTRMKRRTDAGIVISSSSPAPIVFSSPPQLIVVPETNIYVVPDVEVEIFFYSGWWWRPSEGHWYRSKSYNSGWVGYSNVPSFYREIPTDWRSDYRKERWRRHQWNPQLIPHEQVQESWSRWEKTNHWESEETWGVQNLKPARQSQEQSVEIQQQIRSQQQSIDVQQQEMGQRLKKIKPKKSQQQSGKLKKVKPKKSQQKSINIQQQQSRQQFKTVNTKRLQQQQGNNKQHGNNGNNKQHGKNGNNKPHGKNK